MSEFAPDGSEVFTGQDTAQAPEGQAAVESPENETEQPTEVQEAELNAIWNLTPEQATEIEELAAKKGFTSVHDFAKAYSNLESKFTEKTTQLSRLMKSMNDRGQQQPASPAATTPGPQNGQPGNTEVDEKIWNEMLTKGPSATIKELVREGVRDAMRETSQVQTEYTQLVDSAMQPAIEEAFADIEPEVYSMVQKMLHDETSPDFNKRLSDALDVISEENYKSADVEGAKAYYKDIFEIAVNFARGKLSKQIIHDNKIKVTRDVRRSYLKKGSAAGISGGGGAKPMGGKSAGGDASDIMARMKNITI